MATLTQLFKSRHHSYFGVGGAGPSDEPCFISKTAGVYTHLQPVKFRVKQDKRVRPEMEGKGGSGWCTETRLKWINVVFWLMAKAKTKQIYGERHPDLLKK